MGLGRWHINDPIVFNTGIKVSIEHFGWLSPDENPKYRSMSWNEREDDYDDEDDFDDDDDGYLFAAKRCGHRRPIICEQVEAPR